MSTSAKSSSKKTKKPGLFRRLDICFPWLKLIAVCVIGLIILLDLLDFTISKTRDPYDKIKIAPMAKHVRVSERTLEGKKIVALTFDDGPSAETTPRLLDVLYQKDAVATFFMLGSRARHNPDIVLRAVKDGHEVASHTMYHQNLARIPAGAIADDVNEAQAVFREILGQSASLSRPPYGNINDHVRAHIGTPMILWSVDTLDWKHRNTESIMGYTLDQVYDGAIILMHDIHPTSVDAVPTLIDTLRADGYEFATISELIAKRNITLVPGASYYSFAP